jgi:hypothetical protein
MPVGWRGDRDRATSHPTYTGFDVVIVRNGKIAVLYVFLDPVQL